MAVGVEVGMRTLRQLKALQVTCKGDWDAHTRKAEHGGCCGGCRRVLVAGKVGWGAKSRCGGLGLRRACVFIRLSRWCRWWFSER